MAWLKDVWELVEKVATLTSDIERANTEIKEIRRDLNALTLAVTELKSNLEHEKEKTELRIDSFKSELDHSKESIAAKFEVLTGVLDRKVADFERRLPPTISNPNQKALGKGKPSGKS